MISVVILTKDSERTLERTLKSINRFDEVLILDTGSKDNTLDIAKKFKNVKVHKISFTGFGKVRNVGAKLAKNNWILALDSDEVLSSPLIDELLLTKLDKSKIYSFSFHNFLNSKQMKCCGWYPESHVRLYNKNMSGFTESLVHEKLKEKTNLKIENFQNPILHTPYLETEDFLRKMQIYTLLFAKQNVGKKKSSMIKAISHAIFAFFKSYILKKGIFYKKEGLIISIYNANTAFYKYLKLLELNSKKR